jgi:hypothetical protein
MVSFSDKCAVYTDFIPKTGVCKDASIVICCKDIPLQIEIPLHFFPDRNEFALSDQICKILTAAQKDI